MKRKTREEKAITLIALIITIVVLLILAVVAINAVTGDGIIQHASNARDSYEKAQDEEQDILSYYEQYLATEGKTGDWVQNKNVIKNVKTGQELEVGDYVNYKSGVSTYKDENGEEKAWGILGVENGHILLVSADDVTTKKLEGEAGYLNGVAELNEICKDYDSGIGVVANSGRSINEEDINKVTGYKPSEVKFYNTSLGRVSQYGNKVTYTLREDTEDLDGDGNKTENRLYYTSAAESEEKASGGYPDKFHQKFEDIDGTQLLKESEYEAKENKEGYAKAITKENNFYRYYPTTLTSSNDENSTIKGITENSKAYSLLFADEEEYYLYWLSSQSTLCAPATVSFNLRVVWEGKVDGCRLLYACGEPNSSDTMGTIGVRAVVKLESNVILEDRNNDKTYEIYYE